MAGDLESVTQTEVVVKPKVGAAVTVPANDIDHIDYDAGALPVAPARPQPEPRRAVRGAGVLCGCVSKSSGGDANLASGEIDFLTARTNAKVALADPTKPPPRLTDWKAFLGRNKDHYRYYAAQQLLGEVLLAANDVPSRERICDCMRAVERRADGRQAGKWRILFRQGNAAGEAQKMFDEIVAGAKADDPATAACRLEAMLGQRNACGHSATLDAIPVFAQIARDAHENDSRLQAEAYIGQERPIWPRETTSRSPHRVPDGRRHVRQTRRPARRGPVSVVADLAAAGPASPRQRSVGKT
ncbi:MAG: hypothetical protein U0992_13550 [Planctomycetaceae bacterium]